MPVLTKKPIQFIATRQFNEDHKDIIISFLVPAALMLLKKHPVDMFVFEPKDEQDVTIRSAGYRIDTEEEILDEETTVFDGRFAHIERKFWLKLDDNGDDCIATFLYPEEY